MSRAIAPICAYSLGSSEKRLSNWKSAVEAGQSEPYWSKITNHYLRVSSAQLSPGFGNSVFSPL